MIDIDLIFLIKNHTDTLNDQTKAKPLETLEYKLKMQMKKFSFSPPINSLEEGKWLSAKTSFEATNSVFLTNENKGFSVAIPGQWNSKSARKTIGELNKLLELRSRNEIELHVEQVRTKA